MQVLADCLVAREQAVVRVEAGCVRMVVARAAVAVAAQLAALAPHDHDELRVRLVSDHHIAARPASWRVASRMFAASSKRAISSMMNFLAARAASTSRRRLVIEAPRRYGVCLIASTSGSLAAWRRKSMPAQTIRTGGAAAARLRA